MTHLKVEACKLHVKSVSGVSWALLYFECTFNLTTPTTKPSSGGHECSGSSGIPVQSIRSHHSTALSPSLVTCTGANFLQASRASAPVPPWTRFTPAAYLADQCCK